MAGQSGRLGLGLEMWVNRAWSHRIAGHQQEHITMVPCRRRPPPGNAPGRNLPAELCVICVTSWSADNGNRANGVKAGEGHHFT
jgi:hypothetical protein